MGNALSNFSQYAAADEAVCSPQLGPTGGLSTTGAGDGEGGGFCTCGGKSELPDSEAVVEFWELAFILLEQAINPRTDIKLITFNVRMRYGYTFPPLTI